MTNKGDLAAERSATDLARQPVSAVLWWCLPLALGIGAGFLRLPLSEAAAIWSASFVWMGAGCVLNARRCHRLHCYISGPAFLAGALFAALIASGATLFGARALSDTIGATFALVLASFVPELFGRKYL
jgi:hypothetical protein